MKCEKCGHEIKTLLVNFFNHDGDDSFYAQLFEEDEGVVIVDANQNWTGYDLSEEEMAETILCPNCKQFPFKNPEIDAYNVVRVVCFKADAEEESEAPHA